MIVLDIETSGLNPNIHGILEIAALKFESPDNFFYGFSKLDNFDEIDPNSFKISGYTEKKARNVLRISQKRLLIDFFDWVQNQKDFYIAGENIGSFDYKFIEARTRRYNLKFPFQARCFDLQTLAQMRYEQVYGKMVIVNGKSKLGLPQILNFVGIEDKRNFHNAFEDVCLEAEAISRLRFGKNLIKDYKDIKIPNYLK